MQNPQTHPFPPISQMERSWEQNLRAALDLLAPGAGIRSGLALGIPLASGQPTTGLTPTLTNGYLVQGDQVVGPYGADLISAAPASVANRRLFFGLSGLYYAGSDNLPAKTGDILIGSLTTGSDRIIHCAQQYNYGGGRFGVRGLVNLANVTDGADQTLFTWTVPSIGLGNVRITYAQTRMVSVVTGGNDANDNFVFKVKRGSDSAIDLVTIAHSALVTAGGITRNVSADADAVSWNGATALDFIYNQTDATTAIAGGLVEVFAELVMF